VFPLTFHLRSLQRISHKKREKAVNKFGIETESATDGIEAHVFVVFSDWALNGDQIQSRPLSMNDVDVLIDELIDAQRRAKSLLAEFGEVAS
jgi:hypothetical protein